MRHRSHILSCTLAISALFWAGSAAAGGFEGLSTRLSLDYGNYDFSGGGPSLDSWGIAGAGRVRTGLWDMNLQLDGGYHHIAIPGPDLDDWNVAGTGFWLGPKGRIGVSVGYDSLSNGSSFDVTDYGAFGEWWPTDSLTFSGKAGGFSGSFGLDGYYLGGGASAYIHQDFRLTANIDYTSINSAFDETDYGIGAEWLISRDFPLSIGAGYRYTDFSGTSSHVDTFMLSLTWYCDEEGDYDTSLVGRQRGGAITGPIRLNALATKF